MVTRGNHLVTGQQESASTPATQVVCHCAARCRGSHHPSPHLKQFKTTTIASGQPSLVSALQGLQVISLANFIRMYILCTAYDRLLKPMAVTAA